MRICLVSQEFPPYTNWGGIAVYYAQLAAGLAARGHEVVVVSRRAAGAPAHERRHGAAVVRVGAPIARKRLAGRTIDRLLHARDVRRAVEALDRVDRFDVFETGEASLEAGGLARKSAFRRRLVIQCHGSNAFGEAPGGALGTLHRLDWTWSLRRETQLLGQAAVVAVPSEAMRSLVAARGIPSERIALVPHGVDIQAFSPEGRTDRRGPVRVGFVGRLEKRKGLDFIWRVIDRLGPTGRFEFHLKGARHPASRGETDARLSRYSAVVHHHAPGGYADMPSFYRSIDVLLQPSRFESFGLAYVEAMASGVLVLAGRGGAAPELVVDGVTGFLLDPSGSEDRAVQLLERFAADERSFEAMRASARRDVAERFALSRWIDRKIALYASLAAGADAALAGSTA